MYKRLFSFLVLVSMILSLLPQTALAVGKDFTGYTPIATKKELLAIGQNLSGNYYLTEDIDLSGSAWTPLGTYSAPFSGILDGNGHTLSGMTLSINGGFSDNTLFGLFKYLQGTVKNLTVSQANLTCMNNASRIRVGGIAAMASEGTVLENCHVTGSLFAYSKNQNVNCLVGGLIAEAGNGCTVTNCSFSGELYLLSHSSSGGYMGGLVGLAGKNCSITQSQSHGAFQAETNISYPSNLFLGGMVGKATTVTLLNCTNRATLSANAKNRTAYVGGIVGRTFVETAVSETNTIGNCFNFGNITSTCSSSNYAGGIAGCCEYTNFSNCLNTHPITVEAQNAYVGGITADTYYSRETDITNCHNAGSLTVSCTPGYASSGTPRISACVGGITGATFSTVSLCSNSGTVSIDLSSTDGEISGMVGGILGGAEGNVTACYNKGTVQCTYQSEGSGYIYVGGIAGHQRSQNNYGTSVSNCYNTGNFSATGTCGWLRSYSGAGGVCGTSSTPISQCYNVGQFFGENAIGRVGGLIGASQRSYSTCYFPEVFSYGDGTGNQTQGRVSLSAMETADTFAGFDFRSVWTMVGSAEYPYPELIGNEMDAPLILQIASLPDKITYLEGKDPLDLTGATLSVLSKNGVSQTLPITEDMVSGFDNTTPGNQLLTVTYKGLSCHFNIRIQEKSLVAMELTKLPDKLSYLECYDKLDVTGGALTASYNNDTTDEIPLTRQMVSGFDNTQIGPQTLTVTYLDFTFSFDITIREKSLVGISLSRSPTKNWVYQFTETLDISGCTLLLSYDNATTDELPVVDAMVSGFDPNTPGKQALTVTYSGFTTTLEITLCPPGDFDKTGDTTNTDVIHLLWHSLYPNQYTIDTNGDFNSDGVVTNTDVVHLLWHTLFPSDYPL